MTMLPCTLRRLVALGALSIVLAACGGDADGSGSDRPGSGGMGSMGGGAAPGDETASYQQTPEAIASGRRIYEAQSCVRCHKPDGSPGLGPSLLDAEWAYGGEPENIYESIMHGRPKGMAPYEGRLGAQEVWHLVAYLRSEAAAK